EQRVQDRETHRGDSFSPGDGIWQSAWSIATEVTVITNHRRAVSEETGRTLYIFCAIFRAPVRARLIKKHASRQAAVRLSQVLGRVFRTRALPADEPGRDGSARLGQLRHHHRHR